MNIYIRQRLIQLVYLSKEAHGITSWSPLPRRMQVGIRNQHELLSNGDLVMISNGVGDPLARPGQRPALLPSQVLAN